jgi:hypothetical protein
MPKDSNKSNDNKENIEAVWLEQQAKITRPSTIKPYDYFSFASLLDQSRAFTNRHYSVVLQKAKETLSSES